MIYGSVYFIDAIIDIEQALFIVEAINIVDASAFIKEVNR